MFRNKIVDLITAAINITFGIAVLGLFFRFIFRLFGANPSSDFVRFLYDSTNPLLSPFRTIFEPYVIENRYVLEFSTLIAIAIYLLAAWLLTELIQYVNYSGTTYRTRKVVTKVENE